MTSAAMNTNWAGAAGNATLAFCGRWIGRGLVYAFRHPLSVGMGLVLTTGILFGANNALFEQTARHPAPLFMDTASVAQSPGFVEAGTPVRHQPIPSPLPNAHKMPTATAPVVTPAAPVHVTIPDKVGNKDVAELQARLVELGFFSGKIDGYYGPQTADAIRRFETEAGLNVVGAVTPEVLTAALAYRPAPTPQPVAAAQPVAAVQPATARAVEANVLAVPEDDPIGRIAAEVASVEAAQEAVVPASVATAPAAAETAAAVTASRPAAIDPELVRMVQTGLSRLGFLHAEISGRFDADTARAIRKFEVYNNFHVTGELTPDLVDVLMAAGAYN